FTPTQSSVQLSIAYSSFNTNANTLCFTLDSVNYQQQSASVSSTQLVQVSNKINDGYRFGYGNHEKLNEISGEGNTIDMGDRWLDTRIGRTPKTDLHKFKYPSLSPYSVFNGNPIFFKDPTGKDGVAYWDNSGKTKTLVIKADYHYIKGQFNENVLNAVQKEYSKFKKIDYNGEKINVRFEIGFVSHDEGIDLSSYNGSNGQNRLLNYAIADHSTLELSNREEVGVDMSGISGSKTQKITPDGKMTPLSGNGIFEMQVSSISHGIGHNIGLRHDDGGVMKDQQANLNEDPGMINPNEKIYTRTFYRNNVLKSNVQNLTNRIDDMNRQGHDFWKGKNDSNGGDESGSGIIINQK
ncbi:MAG: hypothetical protein RLZZ236_2019, partial [Bacteroidota bacterium]